MYLLFVWLPSFFADEGKNLTLLEDFVDGPRIHLEGKWIPMVDESTLNLTVILHGITQPRGIVHGLQPSPK